MATVEQATAATGRRPNIVFIMIDDLGWMDLACQGNKLVETPRIDKLAADGIRFTDAYAAAPVCSPTRAAVMTGLSPARLRITNHLPDQERFTPDNAKWLPAEMYDGLAADHTTIAERLKQAGYETAFMGKWHLAGRADYRRGGLGDVSRYPEKQGFDINLGGCALGGPPSFFSPFKIHNLPDRKDGEYLPDRFADEAIDYIESHRDKPFFLALWNYTVHWPMEAPAELLEKYKTRTGPGLNDTRYGAMIEAMDASIGRIVDKIDALKLGEDTLIIFTSDNGGFSGVADNRPLRKGKGYLYEGGIRVPLIVRWTKRIAAGQTNDTPVVSMDWYPTFLAAAGIEREPEEAQDGENLLPLLLGEGKRGSDTLYFHYPNYAFHRDNRLGSAIRSGDYKLIQYADGGIELYNLKSDLSEKREIGAQHPKMVAQLKSRLQNWLVESKAALPSPAQPKD